MHALLYALSFLLTTVITALATPNTTPLTPLFARRSLSGNGAATLNARAAWPQTNAERLARGLTPLSPRRLYSPTRVRRQLPSSTPSLTANVGVFKQDGSRSGYMNSQGGIATTQSQSTTFMFRNPTSANDLLEFNNSGTNTRSVFAANTNPFYVGPGSSNSLIMSTSTFSSPAGSTQQADTSKAPTQYSESTVWSIEPSTGLVKAYWVNADNTQARVHFVQRTAITPPLPPRLSIVLVGDVAAYKAAFPTQTLEEVNLIVAVS
jgi:hypothetical protein